MRKTPPEIERDIRRRLLEGESYESAALGRVQKSTVNRIVEDTRKDMPDFDELRELNIRLKREGITVSEALQNMQTQVESDAPIDITYFESLDKNPALKYLQWTLENHEISIACKHCRNQFSIRLETAPFYYERIYSGQCLPFVCPHCRYPAQYSPFEILGSFALSLLEKDTSNGQLTKL
jgi:hypothetical protein